jgi:hypothetical protein
MKNEIKRVSILLDFKRHSPAELVPFCTANKNALTSDSDIPATGSPVTMANYGQQITDVSTAIASRQTSASKPLTADEHLKVNILMNSAESIARYVEITANTKFAGDVNTITKIFTRLGYSVRQHGTHGTHIFEVVETAKGSAMLRAPSAGAGAVFHFRWGIDGTTWVQLRSSHESTVVINGLPSEKKVYFEMAVTMPTGNGNKPTLQANDTEIDWSDPISELIP